MDIKPFPTPSLGDLRNALYHCFVEVLSSLKKREVNLTLLRFYFTSLIQKSTSSETVLFTDLRFHYKTTHILECLPNFTVCPSFVSKKRIHSFRKNIEYRTS